MQRIALFGGAFDPPHLGHVLTITALLNSKLVDEVWVIPVGDERTDKKPIAPANHRREMVELMLKEFFSNEPVRLESMQLDGKLPGSYTVDLLRTLQNEHPNNKFMFVIGADNASKIINWKEGSWLIEHGNFIVMPRLGEPQVSGIPENFLIMDLAGLTQTNASSSAIRGAIDEKLKIHGIVPKSVSDYFSPLKIY